MNAEKTKPRPVRGKGIYYGYIVAAASLLIMACCFGVTGSFGVFLKPVAAEFGWPRALASGAYSVFVIMFGSAFIFTGRLNDRLGPRKMAAICGVIFGVGHILLYFLGAVWQLYALYAIVIAAGMSTSYIPLTSTTSRWFIKKRGLMVGIVSSGVGGGPLIFGPVIGWLITLVGWRLTYV